MLHRIRKIVTVTPYNIVCEWVNGEIREIQMEDHLKEWAAEPQSVYKKLLDFNIFKKVQLDLQTKTLFWDNLLKMKDASGNFLNAALDIDPEVLYSMSIPITEKTQLA